MIRTPRHGVARVAWRATLMVVLAGAALLAPVQMARSAPETRFATLAAGLVGVTGAKTASFVGPTLPSPAGPVLSMPFPASHLGTRWQGSEDAAVEVRLAGPDGHFGVWRRLLVDHDLEDEDGGPVLSQLIRVDGVTQVQVRAAGEATGIEVVAIDTVAGPRRWELAIGRPAHAADPPPKEEPREATANGATTASDTPDTPGTQVAQPPVITRAEWGADESLRKSTPPKYAPITKLLVHHTVTSPGAEDPDPASTVRAIYAYHTQGNGWDDIGYNFLVDHEGRIYEGRWARPYAPGEIPTGENEAGYGVVGAHAANYNFGSAAVSVIGDFTSVEPSSPAMAAVERLLSWKADRHDIDVTKADLFTATDGTTSSFPNLGGHRDVGRTACPGDRLYPLLPGLRQRVAKSVVLAHSVTRGYWTATADGRVLGFGEVQSAGSLAGKRLNGAIAAMAATPSGGGYWLMGSDGGVFTFGDARFFGSTGDIKLTKPVVRLEATPSGKGYWLVASDGGVFAFGEAKFFGSTGGIRLNQPVVGMASTPTGNGYWLVASDGGIFAFGDARFYGSTGDLKLNSPIVSVASQPDGSGYWLVAKDGGVFAFDAPFFGSVPALGVSPYAGSVQLRATSSGGGYYIGDVTGGVFTFGDARFHGADASQRPPKSAVDLVLRPSPPPSSSPPPSTTTASSTSTTTTTTKSTSTTSTSTTSTTRPGG